MARACPICTTDHPDTAERCSHCGSSLPPPATPHGADGDIGRVPAPSAGDAAQLFLHRRAGLVQKLADLETLANAWAAYLVDQQAPPAHRRGAARPTTPLADVQQQIIEAQEALRRFDDGGDQ